MSKLREDAVPTGKVRKSPMDTAGLIIRTSAARTFGPVTTFSGQEETQKVIDRLLYRGKTPPRRDGR